MLTGKKGILNKATEAKEKTTEAEAEEQSILNNYEEQITNYAGINWDLAKANAKSSGRAKKRREIMELLELEQMAKLLIWICGNMHMFRKMIVMH